MTSIDYEANLGARAELFKALGHPVRLFILNLMEEKPRHGEELAAILSLQPATISHHLSALARAGLVVAEKDQYYQVYSLVQAAFGPSLRDLVFVPQPGLAPAVEPDAYRAKVLRTFMKPGRPVQLPAQLKKRLIVLERLVEEFEPDRKYTEREVNQILVEFNEDVATLRRYMVDYGLMDREAGIYWRVDPSSPEQGA